MTPMERVEALEKAIHESDGRGFSVSDPKIASALIAVGDNLPWLLRVARAAVAWRNSHGEGTMTDALIEHNLISAVEDKP